MDDGNRGRPRQRPGSLRTVRIRASRLVLEPGYVRGPAAPARADAAGEAVVGRMRGDASRDNADTTLPLPLTEREGRKKSPLLRQGAVVFRVCENARRVGPATFV